MSALPCPRELRITPRQIVSLGAGFRLGRTYIVLAMKQRYAGEVRHAILSTIASSQRPKMAVVVDPDIDVRNPDQVEWAIAFRSQPNRDVIIVNDLPGLERSF